MSGHKYSEYRLVDPDLEKKLTLIQTLNNMHGEISCLRDALSTAISGASAGLHTTFSIEVKAAKEWLQELQLEHSSILNTSTGIDRLRSIEKHTRNTVMRGRRVLDTLTIALTQKADEMGKKCAKQMAEIERHYLGGQQLLRYWCSKEQIEEWEQVLKDSRQLLDKDQYSRLEKNLKEIDSTITKKIEFSEEQEDKHQKRLYILKAIRQVSSEMGFEELSEPYHETAGDRGSCIICKVDTIDRGFITFSLSLAGISSFSDIDEGHCFEEFDQLSEYLEEEFGIQTKFNFASGDPRPKLREKIEKDLPDNMDLQSSI